MGNQEQPKTAMDTSKSNLLSILIEISLEVCRNLLIQPGPIRSDFLPVLKLNILRTCCQIRDEALPLLYGENYLHNYVKDNGGSQKCHRRRYGFPYHHLKLMKRVVVFSDWYSEKMDDCIASSLQHYIKDRPAVKYFTICLGDYISGDWASAKRQLHGQSNIAKSLAIMRENLVLNIIVVNNEVISSDGLQHPRNNGSPRKSSRLGLTQLPNDFGVADQASVCLKPSNPNFLCNQKTSDLSIWT